MEQRFQARPDVVREDNTDRLRAKLVLQGANIPFTAVAKKVLAGWGVVIVLDFIANAGGVICAAMEYTGATRAGVSPSSLDPDQAALATCPYHQMVSGI